MLTAEKPLPTILVPEDAEAGNEILAEGTLQRKERSMKSKAVIAISYNGLGYSGFER